MANPNPVTKRITKETAAAYAAKRKNPGPGFSIRGALRKILDGDIPPAILKELQNNKVLVNGKLIPRPIKPLSKHCGQAYSYLVIAEALKADRDFVNLTAKYAEGDTQRIELTGVDGEPIRTQEILDDQTVKKIEDMLFDNAKKK